MSNDPVSVNLPPRPIVIENGKESYWIFNPGCPIMWKLTVEGLKMARWGLNIQQRFGKNPYKMIWQILQDLFKKKKRKS